MNNNKNNDNNSLQNITTTVLANASKTPFWTAFKITLGIGLANFLVFLIPVTFIAALVYLIKTIK